jgi:hypothetical protein
LANGFEPAPTENVKRNPLGLISRADFSRALFLALIFLKPIFLDPISRNDFWVNLEEKSNEFRLVPPGSTAAQVAVGHVHAF